VFAGILTLINQMRKAQGKPPVGFVNSILYKHQASRAAFRDITLKGWGGCDPTDGYDLATGIGSPKVPELARAIP
jgi:tripeptidyl-peptidase-1